MNPDDIKIIAFYLPQYYPTPLNNKWYGEGFTEWTNVGKAKSLFKNHYQPRIPADLGYYDLRNEWTREKQALLAKEAGIYGFCYYHYWFGNGHEELDQPFKEVVEKGKPNFPFCLCWANQSWYSKFWNNDINCEAKLIIEQKYDDKEWTAKHFYSLLDAFLDKRYIKVEDRLLFMIYRPLEYTEVKTFMVQWQNLAKENGLKGFFFIGQATNEKDAKKILNLGFDGVNISRKDDFLNFPPYSLKLTKIYNKILRALGFFPYHYEYSKIIPFLLKQNGIERQSNIYPTLIPNWDHSPRSGKRAVVFHNASPELFKKHLQEAVNLVKIKPPQERIIFLKSWNEWGEGNYIEPDLKYGKKYLHVIRDVLFSHLK